MENKYFNKYFEKLKGCGISEEACNKLVEAYGEALNEASYNTKYDSGLAYEGSLLETILTKLTVFAIKINELYPESIRVEKQSIVKVCLLQHISKCVRLTEQTDEWRRNKLGELYTYTEGMPAIGTGLHSLMMAVESGIIFTPWETEAMTIIDRKEDDLQAKFYSSLLSNIVRQANEMVYLQEKALLNKEETEDKDEQ